MATGCLGFERHGRGPSIREGAAFLRRPAPDANRPDPCNKVTGRTIVGSTGVNGKKVVSKSPNLVTRSLRSISRQRRQNFDQIDGVKGFRPEGDLPAVSDRACRKFPALTARQAWRSTFPSGSG